MKQRSTKLVLFGFLKVILFIIIVMVMIYFGKKAYSFGYLVFAEETVSQPPGKKVAITIVEGTSGSELGKTLKEKGLIKDAKVFQVQYMLSEYKDQLKQGSYVLNTSQTSEEMLAILSGNAVEEEETEAAE